MCVQELKSDSCFRGLQFDLQASIDLKEQKLRTNTLSLIFFFVFFWRSVWRMVLI